MKEILNKDSGFTKPVHDVAGLLDRLNHFGNLGDAPIRLRYATLVYMIAQQGIEILNNTLPELPDNFPSREEFGEVLKDYNRCSNFLNKDDKYLIEIAEHSKLLAKETLRREYTDLCSDEVLLWAGAPIQLSMWPENQDSPSINEILDGISKGSIDPLMFDEAQKTGIQLYLVAQHGIEVSSYLTELPDDYPYRDQFQPFLSQMAFEENYLELHRLNESSKTLAENILEKDFPSVFEELKSNRQAENSQENSYRWPENDDFLNENEQGLKM